VNYEEHRDGLAGAGPFLAIKMARRLEARESRVARSRYRREHRSAEEIERAEASRVARESRYRRQSVTEAIMRKGALATFLNARPEEGCESEDCGECKICLGWRMLDYVIERVVKAAAAEEEAHA
jgi:hypothetical protein